MCLVVSCFGCFVFISVLWCDVVRSCMCVSFRWLVGCLCGSQLVCGVVGWFVRVFVCLFVCQCPCVCLVVSCVVCFGLLSVLWCDCVRSCMCVPCGWLVGCLCAC